MKTFYKHIFILLALILIGGLDSCGDASEIEPVANSIESNYSRWKKQGIDSYIITQQRMCFCIDGGAKMFVRVSGNKIISVTDSASAKLIPSDRWQWYKTIDELYATAIEAKKGNPAAYEIKFESVYGYPNYIWVDPNASMADEEYGFVTTNFKPLR